MGALDRALLAVYSLVIAAGLILFGVAYYGLLPAEPVTAFFRPENQVAIAGIVLAMLLVSLRLLWASMAGKGRKRERHAVLEDNSLGQVRIALSAIESLAVKLVSQMPGIREVKANVDGDQQGVAISLDATVTPDISIPEVSKEIQKAVQENVKEVTGIAVSGVKVNVENIFTNKPRVE